MCSTFTHIHIHEHDEMKKNNKFMWGIKTTHKPQPHQTIFKIHGEQINLPIC